MMLVILALSLAAITVMAVVAPSLATRQRLDTETKGKALRLGIDRFFADLDRYPNEFAELFKSTGDPCEAVATATPPRFKGWCGSYLEPLIAYGPFDFSPEYQTDGWGTEFKTDGAGKLLSAGPDRTFGTGDDIEFL